MDNKIWILGSNTKKRQVAFWEGIKKEEFVCTKEGIKCYGKRESPLKVKLPEIVNDLMWTPEYELLITDHVLDIFRKEGLTGFEVSPVKVVNSNDINLWEVVITGWGGAAPPETDINIWKERCCEECGTLMYTSKRGTKFKKILDECELGDSDFFIVWPLPKRYFISSKLLNILKRYNLKGFEIIDPEKEILSVNRLSPGRLHYYMPEDRAHELGDPLGIY